ncbi:MAG TPA: hypothetical protein VF286_02740 [Acidiphilium sp.]
MITDEKLNEVARTLWADLYEEDFRGKSRGRFALKRSQLKEALGVERLHASTIRRLQDIALAKGLAIIDLDDLFPCIEVNVLRRYRKPPSEVFARVFSDDTGSSREEEDEVIDFDEDED